MSIRDAIEELNKRPCMCVSCAECRGTGNVAVNYDGLGRFESYGAFDDSYDLETCDSCSGGIVEMCERCMEMEELEQALEEQEQRGPVPAPQS
jgi:hypothetical protein